MKTTELTNSVQFSTGHSLTDRLVADGAPRLPENFEYRLIITHPSLAHLGPEDRPQPASVTARIGYRAGDEFLEVARYTEVTRAHLHGATIAAATHANECFERTGLI